MVSKGKKYFLDQGHPYYHYISFPEKHKNHSKREKNICT